MRNVIVTLGLLTSVSIGAGFVLAPDDTIVTGIDAGTPSNPDGGPIREQMDLGTDRFGGAIIATFPGPDRIVYVVYSPGGDERYRLARPAGEPFTRVIDSINHMAPGGWVEPRPPPQVLVRNTATLIPDERNVTSTDWQRLGGVTTAVAGLVPGVALDSIVGGLVGEATVGAGGDLELRLRERCPATSSDTVLGTAVFPSGDHPYAQWQAATHPQAGPCTYTLEGRLVGATGATLRYTTLALYEVTP